MQPLVRSRTVLDPVDEAPVARGLVRTRFGGLPVVDSGERWPRCPVCGSDLSFVAQVDNARDALHSRLPVSFFTFWYCWQWHPWDRAERHQWLVRAYTRLSEPRLLASSTAEPFAERFAAPRLERSLPDTVGFALHRPELWDAEPDWDLVDRVALSLTGERAPRPHLRNWGVALGGYPLWANGPDETPPCPDCTRPTELLLQIRPTELTDATWGDLGTLYLFMCRTHPGRTALRMQCT
ncbi:hypothetical protein Val02_10230 [Virgisporangium aliadipatigenens]|uniref:DUF1963 domain-containing protein n=1 Tax=Virgisporangium aliadipatigenens TaxID=741659 RepID=A0A8J3YH41_9ACTN|nr:hypothetical protein Val02_10230 [Virgisporangium aliadipatigenens]